MPFYTLSQVATARAILDTVAAELRQQGQQAASVQLHGHPQVHQFDVMSGITFFDHGHGIKGLKCQACANGHTLRYEFRIRTLDGHDLGPIGSGCIFTRMLGQDQAKKLGKGLERGLEAYQTQIFAQDQQQALQQAGTWRDYVRGLGFDWVLLALAGEGYIEPNLKARLVKAQQHNQPLTAQDIEALHGHKGRARATTTPKIPTPRAAAGSVAATFQAQLGATAAGIQRGGALKGRPSLSPRLSPSDWEKYVITKRLTNAVQYWEGVEAHLECDDETKAEIKETLDGHRTVRFEHYDLLLRACKATTLPYEKTSAYILEQQRQQFAAQHLAQATQEAEAQREREKAYYTRLRNQLEEDAVAVTGQGLVDIRDTPLEYDIRSSLRLVEHLIPAARKKAIREALSLRCLRQDDLTLLQQTLPICLSPQPDPSLRTIDVFKRYIEIRFRSLHRVDLLPLLPSTFAHPNFEQVFAHPIAEFMQGQMLSDQQLARLVKLGCTPRPKAERALPLPRPATGLKKSGATTLVVARSRKQSDSLVEMPADERAELLRLWGQGLAEVFPKEERKGLRRALERGEPLPERARAVMQAFQSRRDRPALRHDKPEPNQARPHVPSVLEADERDMVLTLWGKGLAEVFPQKERKAVRRALERGETLPEEAITVIRAFRARQATVKPVLGAASQDAPALIRTPTAFTAQICRLLSAKGADHVRLKLVRQPLSWAAQAFPQGFGGFLHHGTIGDDLLKEVERALEK